MDPAAFQIRRIDPSEHAAVLSVYEASNYKGGIKSDDIGFLATLNNAPVGAVRLTHENGFLLLRGMMVHPYHQRQGIGKEMLTVLDKHIGTETCYLVGREHLVDFYGRIGFTAIAPSEAPTFLALRREEYNQKHHDSIIMRRDKTA
jgi:predicted N-acetyltransferase YhbS